jgi:hypothetical protein
MAAILNKMAAIIFLWNYESIKVGVQLVFNIIWEWHRFTAVIWKNDTKSFIFPKLKMISVQNFEDKQIRGHWYNRTCPFFFCDINYIDKKIDQIILEQVPCLRNFMKKWQPFLVLTKFCTDIIRKFTFFKITSSFLVRIWSSRYQIKDILKIYNLK